MATPHNNAEKKDIAKTVIMPGDPLRAKFIAENWLETPVLFNEVRNMYGYTGIYKGKEISVMASGMGMPSMGIYSYELYRIYDVDKIIRVGSAGSYCSDLKIFDTMLVDASYSESSYAYVQNGCEDHVLFPSAGLNREIEAAAKELNKKLVEKFILRMYFTVKNQDIIKSSFGRKAVWRLRWKALHCFIMQMYAKNRRHAFLPYRIPSYQMRLRRRKNGRNLLRI